MRGDEVRVVDAFAAWLEADGWTVTREVAFVDLYGERGGERLYAEAKGRTTAPGLDVDTMYGQLLRRMVDDADSRYAVVVPDSAAVAAQRVPAHVRQKLRIEIYAVGDDGDVRLVE